MGSFFSKFPEIRHPVLLKMESNIDFFQFLFLQVFRYFSEQNTPSLMPLEIILMKVPTLT